MKPATRSLISGLLLVMLFTLIAMAGVQWQVTRTLQGRSMHKLQLSGPVANELQANRLQELQLRAEVLAHDSAFVDYVAQSLIPNPQLGGAVDSVSISDLLTERRKGYDIASVLNTDGKPVATAGILLLAPKSVQADPLVRKAIKAQAPVQGIWIDHGKLLWVAINPLLRGGALQGVLLTATHVDDAFAIAVSRIAGSDVAFVIEPDAASGAKSSNGAMVAAANERDSQEAQTLSSRLSAVLAMKDTGAFPLDSAGYENMAWVTPMDSEGGRAALVAFDSQIGGMQQISPEVRPLLSGLAALGVIGLLVVIWLWFRTWLPLQQVLAIVERAALTGDRELTSRVRGSLIVRLLRDAINQLLHR